MRDRSRFSLIHPDRQIISLLFLFHLLTLVLLSTSAAVVMSGGGGDGRLIESEESGQFDNNRNHADDGSRDGGGDRRFKTELSPPTGGDSGEDAQYYEDDPAVTFITEDDVYDDFGDGAAGSMRFYAARNHPHYQDGALRKQLERERCPPLPEEPSDVKLCQHSKCSMDSDCSDNGSIICCYNGCVHSCQHKVDPPPAFDWLEETQLKGVQNFSRIVTPSGGSLSSKQLMGADTTAETIAIPGGCFLTPQQYDHLRLFRKLQHVNSCKCMQGDVVCHVNRTRV